jgi:hypothetical protein
MNEVCRPIGVYAEIAAFKTEFVSGISRKNVPKDIHPVGYRTRSQEITDGGYRLGDRQLEPCRYLIARAVFAVPELQKTMLRLAKYRTEKGGCACDFGAGR